MLLFRKFNLTHPENEETKTQKIALLLGTVSSSPSPPAAACVCAEGAGCNNGNIRERLK